MDDVQMIAPATIAWLGAGLGAVFGVAGNRSNFCTMGAVADIVNMGAWTRMRMWIFAMGIAVLGTGAMQLAGVIDVGKTIYTAPRLLWLSHLVGGLLFGVGMTLAGGCGAKTLIRLGGGNLKSLVVFVFVAIAGYMTLKGLFAVWRANLIDPVSVTLPSQQDLPSLLAGTLGVERARALMLLMTIVGGGASAFALASREFRKADPLLGALAVGLVVVAGWYVSGHLGYVAEHPDTLGEVFIATNTGRAESLSFVAPYAFTMELLTMWSDASRIVTFGIASALGVIAGSALYALASGNFRVEGFHDPADLARHILGAILMGFGGVTALGCSIGQSITGLSTLSIGSLLTAVSIVAGATATVKWQYWRAMQD